ncbi:MAG: GrpB family protein [Acholeplasmataceae bacterium]|nr:GrpB family protein [Acholeplasmataceae bacterium]
MYFRAYLQKYLNISKQYAALKTVLKEQFEHDRDSYTYAKTDFIMKQSQKAKLEFAGRYLPPKH